MKTQASHSAVNRVLLVLSMAGAMVAVAFVLRWWPQRSLGRQWQQQLATVPDERALEHLERIASLGDQGTKILVTALGSSRQSIARNAQTVLTQQVDRWSAFDVAKRSQRVAVLVEALAERVERFGPSTRRFAADLVLRVTAWPTADSVDRLGLITQGEIVVRAATQFNTALGEPAGGNLRAARLPREVVDRRGEVGPAGTGRVRIEEFTDLPGGQLPVESISIPSRSGGQGSGLQPDQQGQPRRLDVYPDAEPIQDRPSPRPIDPSGARRLWPGDNRIDDRYGTRTSPQNVGDDAPSVTAAADLSADPSDLRAMAWLDLLRRLHSQRVAVVQAAEAELLARGFRPFEVQLGRQLTDPDASIRLAFARRLPTLGGLNAARWLVELTRDEDAEVRLSAFSTLATTRNRQLQDHVRSLAPQDADPRIRRLAEQLDRGLRR